MIIRRLFAMILVLISFCSACNSNVQFGGRVTHSDDGSPVTQGVVCFETPTFLARGPIDKNGNYNLGSLTANDGIPKGEYTVYITGTEKIESIADSQIYTETGGVIQTSKIDTGDGSVIMGDRKITPTIDPKYSSVKTSGMKVTIDGTNKRFDFEVERFIPKKRN